MSEPEHLRTSEVIQMGEPEEGASEVRFVHRREGDGWSVHSDELPGWEATGGSLEATKALAEQALVVHAEEHGFTGHEVVIHLTGT